MTAEEVVAVGCKSNGCDLIKVERRSAGVQIRLGWTSFAKWLAQGTVPSF